MKSFINSLNNNVLIYMRMLRNKLKDIHYEATQKKVYMLIGIEVCRIVILGILCAIALIPFIGLKLHWIFPLGLLIWLPIQVLAYAVSEVKNVI